MDDPPRFINSTYKKRDSILKLFHKGIDPMNKLNGTLYE